MTNLITDTSTVFSRELRPVLRNPFTVVFSMVQPLVFLALFAPLLPADAVEVQPLVVRRGGRAGAVQRRHLGPHDPDRHDRGGSGRSVRPAHRRTRHAPFRLTAFPFPRSWSCGCPYAHWRRFGLT